MDLTSNFGGASANGQRRAPDTVRMFEPKRNNSLNVICTENPTQEMAFLLNLEYNQMREKQDRMDEQAEQLKAKEQEQKDAAAAAESGAAAASGGPPGAPGAQKTQDQAALDKIAEANRKELKARAKRLEQKQRNEGLFDRGMSNQGAFNVLAGKKKSTGGDDDAVESHGVASSNKNRPFPRMAPDGLIGEQEKKQKEVVVLSKKAIDETTNDISTLTEKVLLKDLIAVLKSDSRLAHKPLVYQLQNRVK